MTRAIAIVCEGKSVCCRCAYRIAMSSGYPHLWAATTRHRMCDEQSRCQECGGTMLNDDVAAYIRPFTELVSSDADRRAGGGKGVA